MNTQRFKEAVAYLGSKSSKLPVASKDKIRTGELALRTNDLFIRKRIAFGGKVALIDANTQQLAGVSSFDGNKLNEHINHIFDKIKIGYATDAATGKEALLSYATALPVDLRNAQLHITQGNKVIFTTPVSTIYNANTGNTIMDDFRKLDNFEMLVSNEQIGIEIEFPDSATAGTPYHYVEVIIGGFTTFTK